MYKLFIKKGSCSMAIHALLNFLEQKVELQDKTKTDDYKSFNPTGAAPFLIDGSLHLPEGAAIALYLMEKHNSSMLPQDLAKRATTNQWMMFANATLHPSYSRLFFLNGAVKDENMKKELMAAAAESVNNNWKIVDQHLASNKYVMGEQITMADLFMAVYANWNHNFGGAIQLGPNVTRMVKEVAQLPAFQKTMEAEGVKYTVK